MQTPDDLGRLDKAGNGGAQGGTRKPEESQAAHRSDEKGHEQDQGDGEHIRDQSLEVQPDTEHEQSSEG